MNNDGENRPGNTRVKINHCVDLVQTLEWRNGMYYDGKSRTLRKETMTQKEENEGHESSHTVSRPTQSQSRITPITFGVDGRFRKTDTRFTSEPWTVRKRRQLDFLTTYRTTFNESPELTPHILPHTSFHSQNIRHTLYTQEKITVQLVVRHK